MATEKDETPVFKQPLTESELQEIWQQDDYHGIGGSYTADPFTGKRTPKED